jgi:glycosyltransferase involved in cell wall biosynthesis
MPFSEQCAEVVRRNGAKLVLTCWENIPFRFEEDRKIAARKRLVADACDLFIAVTAKARDALVAEGVATERIVVVPAGVDTERFAPHTPDPNLLARLDVPLGAFVVLFVGRMIREKGVVDLTQAVSRLPAVDGRPVHLVLAGAGPERDRVISAANALGCADRVHVQPGVRYGEVASLYACADVVVAPSLPTPYWEEQFGMVLVEAMACGRPLITTNSGSIPDVVGDAAVLVRPYDVNDLSNALTELASGPEERARLATAGRERVLANFDSAVVGAKLAEAYHRVLIG